MTSLWMTKITSEYIPLLINTLVRPTVIHPGGYVISNKRFFPLAELHSLKYTLNMTLYHRNKNTCWEEKICFALLWHCGFSVRAISKVARRSPTTVRKWVRHLRETSLSHHSVAATPVPPHNSDLLVLANLRSQGYAISYPNLRSCMCGCQYYEGRSTWEGCPTGTVPVLPDLKDSPLGMKQQIAGHSGVSFPSSFREYPDASHLVRCDGKSQAESCLTENTPKGSLHSAYLDSQESQSKTFISRAFQGIYHTQVKDVTWTK